MNADSNDHSIGSIKKALEILRNYNIRHDNDRVVLKFLKNGGYPWAPGYGLYKERFIIQALSDEKLIDIFRTGASLPVGYGIGIDERCVEYPWIIANLSNDNELILDAGSVMNYGYILDQSVFKNKIIHIVTLAPEYNCYWMKGISYIYGDLRDTPVRDSYYDNIICASTLEHIGCDNSYYTGKDVIVSKEEALEGKLSAVREMRRILKPGGRLMITVPFGTYRHFSTFQQFDDELLSTAIDAFGPSAGKKVTFFKYNVNGWEVSTSGDCARAQYVEWVATHPLPDPVPVEKDKAAAARAVACVMLVKP